MELDSLTAISPIDGRYADKVDELRDSFSEYGLIRRRVEIEVKWLLMLAARKDIQELPSFTATEKSFLLQVIDDFSMTDALQIKKAEKTTNHDVKAVEYFLRDKLADNGAPANAGEFVHFACTSEDINNLSYALCLRQARDSVILPVLSSLLERLLQLAEETAAQPMLARTHGQPASPTTLGKELAVFICRLQRQLKQLAATPVLGKFNGAVGNFNAHLAAYPDINWMQVSREFVESLDLTWNPHTTQIEPHDYMAEMFHCLARMNTILIDLCRDLWGYIALGYFGQRRVETEVGSSTMPHKVNPIDFENSEGNLGLANNHLLYLAEKLPLSRWQRDLTDSTTLRTIGTAFAHSLIAYKACHRGLDKLQVDSERIRDDLDKTWEVLAEALQTVMRRFGIAQSYEQLKVLTRGESVDRQLLHDFIAGLPIPKEEKQRLRKFSPDGYIGNAVEQVQQVGALLEDK